jgi:hypothetical protein
MSEPKRWDLWEVILEETDSTWVRWEDYARLKAEVERLTKAVMHSPAAQLKLKELEGKTTFEEINPKDDNSNITTELLVLCNRQASDIRRLTKAGDTIIQILCKYVPPTGAKYALMDWRDAKEGKPRD